MAITEPVSTVTRQRVFISRSGVLTIEPCLILVFRVAVISGVRKIDFFPLLNRYSAKFRIGPSENSVRWFKWKKSRKSSTVGSS